MKRIGILTRDCAGVNAAIRAFVRSASACKVEVYGIFRGYQGLIEGDLKLLNHRSVSGIINLGGTILKAARSKQFRTLAGQRQAVRTLHDNKIEGLAVVGGNGSLAGAHVLATKYSIPVIGIPTTIDNDVNGVEMSIGADTAVNVALDALDKIRDTATSLERIFVVEVMGRDCGYIALRVALAGGCEEVLLPEKSFNVEKICEEIVEGNIQGKVSWIIVVAEGKVKAVDIAKKINTLTDLETREVVLGHIQRGGRPTAFDRIIAARYAHHAFEALTSGKLDRCVTLKEGKLTTIPLAKAIRPKDIEINDYYKLVKILT
ncbi:MAG: 6-phosphofructokinase [Candidatus Omnitrophica bacterium]|nr:6-phosphofructokinase [Candidatus Omnitrophota bacterium]